MGPVQRCGLGVDLRFFVELTGRQRKCNVRREMQECMVLGRFVRGNRMKLSFGRGIALAVMCAGLSAASVADAKTFRWANSGDVSSMDPYARQETFLLTFTANIYDPLVRRDKDLKLEAALATKWGQVDPTTWFFDIRPGVKFQDGSLLAADDIVFYLNRANGPGSNMQGNFVSVKEI